MVALAAAFVNQMGHQKRADSFMAGFGSEIDSGLKGLLICLALFPEMGVAIANELTIIFIDKIWKG